MLFFSGVRGDKLAKSVDLFVDRPAVLFSIALLVSACCKLLLLDSRELWLDETYSAFVANLHFADLLRHTAGDVHPPLFYMLLWAWIRIVGDAQTQLRLFGVVLNICSSIGMFILAKRVLGNRFGTFAAVLFAFSPMLFVYSLEVRMYMLQILVFICLLIVHWSVAVEQREAKRLVVAYGLLAALLFYVHYTGVFILLGLFTHWTITSRFARGRIARVCAAGILTMILVSPGIPVLLDQRAEKAQLDLARELSYKNPSSISFGVAEENRVKPDEIKILVKSVAAMAGFYPAKSSLLLLLCAVPLAVVLTGVGFLWFLNGDEVCRLFGLVMLAVVIGALALHLHATRYVLSLVPLLVLALSRVLQYWTSTPRWRTPSLAVGILMLALYTAGFFRQALTHHGRPWQDLVNVVHQNYRAEDKVIFDVLYAQVPFDYFAWRLHFQPQESGFPLSVYDWWNEQRFKAWGGPVVMQSDLDQFVSGLSASSAKTLWLVLYETYYYDPHDALLARLRQLGQVTEFRFPPVGDIPASQEDPPLRLIRISVNSNRER
jgi:hypothetical protein